MKSVVVFARNLFHSLVWFVQDSAAMLCLKNSKKYAWGGLLIGVGGAPGSSITQLAATNGGVYTVSSTYLVRLNQSFDYQFGSTGQFILGVEATQDLNMFASSTSIQILPASITLYGGRVWEKLKIGAFNFDLFGGYGSRMMVATNTDGTIMTATSVVAFEYGGVLSWRVGPCPRPS